jgi:DNA polymerase
MSTTPPAPASIHKQHAHAALVATRKACRACGELENPSVTAGGSLDGDRVGPYSRWQGNLDAELMIVAQDFADRETFVQVGGWPGERVGTNLTLVELIKSAGIDIRPPRRGESEDRLFFTHAVLCLKDGGMQKSVPTKCYRECGRRFLRPTIELVAPRAVAALGTGAVDAVLSAFGFRRKGALIDLIESGRTFALPCGTTVFPLCHPSRTVLNTQRSLEQQQADWARIGAWLRKRPATAA